MAENKRGRKRLYHNPRTLTLLLPGALVEEIEAADVPGAYSKSRNAKIVALVEMVVGGNPEEPDGSES